MKWPFLTFFFWSDFDCEVSSVFVDDEEQNRSGENVVALVRRRDDDEVLLKRRRVSICF